jgi:hypothetical protein
MEIVAQAFGALAIIGGISITILLYYHKQIPAIWATFATVVCASLMVCLMWQNYIQNNQANKTLATQNAIEPNVSCLMEYPIKVEKDNSHRNTSNPTIIIKNSGPVTVVSLSAKINIYVYSTKENKIVNFIKTDFKSFGHAISAKELEPFADIEHSTIGITGNEVIAVYFVSVNYYRKSDMKSFTLNEYFFTQNKKIFNDLEFKTDERYRTIIDKVKTFIPPDTKANGVQVTAADEHTWFMESNPPIITRKNNDGSVTIVGPPENQSESLIKGLPHLLATPSRFEGSGHFIETEIAGEHINLKVKYEVKNMGDVAAVITEDGINPSVEIEHGGKKYYINAFKIARGPNNNRPLQEFLDMLEIEKEAPKITLNLLYRAKSDNSKLFSVVTIYELGKNSFKLVK